MKSTAYMQPPTAYSQLPISESLPLTMNKNSNLCHRVGRARECFLVTNLRLLSVLRSLSHSIVIVKGRKVHLTIITCMTEPPMCSLELTCKMKENISTLMTSNKYICRRTKEYSSVFYLQVCLCIGVL